MTLPPVANAEPSGGHRRDPEGEKDAKLAQKFGQIQPFIAAYSHRNARRANLHRLGQPNTFLAAGARQIEQDRPSIS